MRVAPIVGLTLSIAVLCASSAEAGFTCSASAGRITVLGQKVEPATANATGSDCTAVDGTLTGPATSVLPAPFSAGSLIATTEVVPAQKSVVASGGIADLKVGSLPTLPITLPQVTVPDALKTVSVDISAVKNLLDPTHLNPVVNALPSSITVDASGAVNALLPGGKLPTLDLLRVKGVMAYAAGSCTGGSPVVAGSSAVAGLNVLGTDLPVNQLVEKSLTLIDTAKIDPSQANLAQVNFNGALNGVATLLSALPAAQTALVTALQGALDALPDLKVLDPTIAQVKVVPGLRAQDATSVTQQALTVTVSIAGQTIVDAVIGEAKASSAGVDCSEPVTDPESPTGATLQCSTRKLVLVDVLERGNKVALTGVADPSLAGQTVDIVFNATKKVVAHATVAPDGSFDTTAPLPPVGLRDTNDARYKALLGAEESINLKLRRRMVVRSMTAKDGRVTITGRVIGPLAKPLAAITLTRRVSCTQEKVVTRFKPRRNGFFRVTVKAPKGVGSAVYRMTTKVRANANGSGVFDTYTLPRAVDLGT